MKHKLRLKPEIKKKAIKMTKKFLIDLTMGCAVACVGIIFMEMLAWRYQTIANQEVNYYEESQKKTEMSATQISQKN